MTASIQGVTQKSDDFSRCVKVVTEGGYKTAPSLRKGNTMPVFTKTLPTYLQVFMTKKSFELSRW